MNKNLPTIDNTPETHETLLAAIKNNSPSAIAAKPSVELKYVQLTILIISFSFGIYCMAEYFRQGLIEYLAATIVSAVFFAGSAYSGRQLQLMEDCEGNHDSKLLAESLLSNKLYKKYLTIIDDINKFEEAKKQLLARDVMPQLKELIEKRLPLMLKRQKSYSNYWDRCKPEKLQHEIAQLQAALRDESDKDITEAIRRNIDIAESTAASYEKLKKALRLYELQISAVDRHLENLDTKIHILDLESDLEDAARDIITEINTDINSIEEALTEIELPPV